MTGLGTCHGFSGCWNKVHAVPNVWIMSCGIAVRWHGMVKRQCGVAWWKGCAESWKMAGCVSRALGGLSPPLPAPHAPPLPTSVEKVTSFKVPTSAQMNMSPKMKAIAIDTSSGYPNQGEHKVELPAGASWVAVLSFWDTHYLAPTTAFHPCHKAPSSPCTRITFTSWGTARDQVKSIDRVDKILVLFVEIGGLDVVSELLWILRWMRPKPWLMLSLRPMTMLWIWMKFLNDFGLELGVLLRRHQDNDEHNWDRWTVQMPGVHQRKMNPAERPMPAEYILTLISRWNQRIRVLLSSPSVHNKN